MSIPKPSSPTTIIVYAALSLIAVVLIGRAMLWISDITYSQNNSNQLYSFDHSLVLHGQDAEFDISDSYAPQPDFIDYSGPYSFRGKIEIGESLHEVKPIAARIRSNSSYDFYWDGQLIYKNGTPANDVKDEVEGQFRRVWLMADSLLTPGLHHWELRSSNHRSNKLLLFGISLGNYDSYQRSILIATTLIFLFAGSFLLACIYFAFVYFRNRIDVHMLIFSILCFSFFVLAVLEQAMYIWEYSYSFHSTRLLLIKAVSLISAMLMLAYPLRKFKFPLKDWTVFAFVFIMLCAHINPLQLSWLSDHFNLLKVTTLSGAAFGFILSVRASRANLPGAKYIALGFFPFVLAVYQYDLHLFLAFSSFIFFQLLNTSIELKQLQVQRESALLLSARLQTELLKKNIRPHFLMNTLTSMMEWVEQSPQKGVEFIEALALEFRILNDIVDKKMIPLKKELDLCQTHLDIMQYRKGVEYTLETDNLDLNMEVPPAIFHTLIENGITHAKPEGNVLNHKLLFERSAHGTTFRLITEGTCSRVDYEEGNGLKYVRARLEEGFQNNWRLEVKPALVNWEVMITILD